MSRRNRILTAVAAAAWLLLLAIERPWQGDAYARTAAAVGPLFPGLEYRSEEIVRIVVRDETLTVELALDPGSGRWMVLAKDHPADPRRLAELMDMLVSLRTHDVVAENPESHTVYGVAEGQGTRVQLFDAEGRPVADWIHGRLREQDVTSGVIPVLEFYVRRGDSPLVYLSGDALLPSADPVRWCDTRFLIGLDDADISWVEREDFEGEQSWRIERIPGSQPLEQQGPGIPVGPSVGERWRLSEPEQRPALDYAGDSLIRTLITLRASDVVGRAAEDDAARYGFPVDRFRAGIGSLEFEVELGRPAQDGGRYMRVKSLPHVYRVSDFDAGQLRQPLAKMLED